MQTIKRVSQIFSLFSIDRNELGVSEISRETGIPKGTTHRILKSLEEENFLEQGENGSYSPGMRLFNLGKIVEKNISIINLAHPVLKKLSQKHSCAAHLAFLDGPNAVYIDKYVSNNFFEFASKIGMRVPAYATALGKIMLSYLEEEKIKELFGGFSFKPYTQKTITNLDSLLDELKVCKKQGYAIDNEEICKGLKCYAVPIFNTSGVVEAALSLSKPTNLFESKEEDEIINSLLKASSILNRKMTGQSTSDLIDHL